MSGRRASGIGADEKIDGAAVAAREAAQKKTFTRWANHYMGERMLKINDLFEDLKDGILLINLMELISSKSLGKYDKKPKMELTMLGNIDLALRFIQSEGLKLVNIGPKDIYQGTPKLILGLIWTLILRYQINLGDSSPKQELINWVNKQIKPYQSKGVDPIVNFTSSLQDGKCLAALADSLSPGATEINTDHLDNPLKNVQDCLTVSERDYNIPPLLDAVDVVNNPDEHSAMTYISYFRDYLENKAKDSEVYKTKGANAAASYVTGRGVGEKGQGNIFRGRTQPFVIHSKNVGGEYVVIPKWKAVYTVTVAGPNGPVPVEVKDNEDGTYSGSYVPNSVGAFQVSVVQEGKYGIPDAHVKGSVFHVNVHEGADPNRSYAEGPGLKNAFDDVPAHFTVHCLDKDGRPVAGEDTLAVAIDLVKRADGGAAPKSPATKAAPPPPAAKPKPFCEQCGEKLTGTKFCEGCGAKVPAATGGAAAPPPAASRAGPRVENPLVSPKIKDNGDGTYAVEYAATVAGDYDLNVTIQEQPIRDMPTKLKVNKGIDASKTIAEGRGVKSPGFLGRDHPFTIRTFDRDGAELKAGGGEFKVSVAGPRGPVPCTIKDNGDGTYSGNYKPVDLGTHVVDIKVNKGTHLESIKDNPFTINVKKPADLSKSYAEGEGVHNAADNRPAHFKVFARDEDGKPVSGEWLDVKITPKGQDPKGQSIYPVDIKDNGDGSYNVTYEAKDVGDYNMNAEIADHSIKDMPTNLHVHKGVDASKCIVEGPGVDGGVCGKDLPFTVRAMDGNGNPVKFGGDDFKVEVVGPDGKVPCELKDNGDGTYSGKYHPNKPGIFTVDLTVNNQPDHVGKAPYKCKVRAAGDASKSYAKGKGWRYCYDNQPTSFTVYVKDEKGAPVVGEELHITMSDCSSQEFKDALAARIAQVDPYMLKKKADQDAKAAAERGVEVAKGDVPCHVTDNKDGTYTVNYTAIIPGEYSLNVKVNDKPIKDAPKVIKCHWSCPNAPCAHTMEELHQTIAEQRDQIYQLQKKLAAATGAHFEDRGYDQE